MKKRYPLFVSLAVISATAGAEQFTPYTSSSGFGFVSSGEPVPMIAPDASWQNPFITQIPTLNTNAVAYGSRKAAAADESDGSGLPEIYGVVISSSPYRSYGMKRIPMREGDDFVDVQGMAGTGMTQVTSGAEKDGVFYTDNVVSRYGSLYCVYYMTWDMQTWMRSSYCQSANFLGAARDMATDPVTGEVYGCFMKTHAGVSYVLGTIDYDVQSSSSVVPVRHTIAELDNMLTALFFTADGQLWGIDLVTGPDENGKDNCLSSSLYKIDKFTGDMTLVGETGAKPYYVSSATCDIYGDGTVYWSIKDIDNVGSLYTVDLSTGQATKLFDFPKNEEVVAMHVPLRAAATAPGTPDELRADFPEGSLSGTLSVDIPSVLNDGSDASGLCSYEFFVNGESVCSGQAEYGSTASAGISVPQAGTYTFTGRLKNDAGYSDRVQTQIYVGTGTPAAPQPILSVVGGKAYVVWEPVTGAVSDRGYVNPDEITYTVRRNDGTVVAENIARTQFIEPVEVSQFSLRYYEVNAQWGGNVSGYGRTNVLGVGKIIPPYVETFDDPYLMNNEGSPWLDIQMDNSSLGHWYVHSGEKAACASTGFGQEDSWLISPAVTLESGKTYSLGFDVWGSFDTKPIQFEVYLGLAPAVNAMTTELVAMTSMSNKKATMDYVSTTFTPSSDGDCYIGIHCYTPNGGPSMFVDNLRIELAGEPGRPGKPGNMAVAPISTGSLTARISLTAPAKSYEGQALTGTMDMNISRGGDIVKTFTEVTPGQSLEFTETVPAGGDITYTAVAVNDIGESLPASASGYLGFYPPRPVKSLTLAHSADGTAWNLSWEPNMQDTKWNTLQTSDITFTIVAPDSNGNTVVVSDNIPGDQCEFTVADTDIDGSPKFMQFGIFATTTGGNSSLYASNIVATGKPYSAPYRESFSGTPAGIMYATSVSGMTQWYAMTDNDLEGISSADGDGGYMAMFASYQNSEGAICTGLIDLSGLESPGLSLKVLNLTEGTNANKNELSVAVADGSGSFTSVRAWPDVIGSLGMPGEWVKYVVPLEQFKDKTVQVRISAKATNYIAVMVDDLFIGDIDLCDITALSIYGSNVIEEGEDGAYTVTMLNNGYDIAYFSVDLLRDGNVVASEMVDGLKPGVFTQVTLADRPDVDSEATVSYSARIDAYDDTDQSDNEIGPIVTSVVLPAFPSVEDLGAEDTGDGIALSWTDPGTEYVPNPTTESFENYTPWLDLIDGWTLIDADGEPISMGSASGLGNMQTGDLASFVVAESDAKTNMTAHYGDHFILKFAPGTGTGDDWIISPELFGMAQTVSVWARSYSDQTPDNLEILYSTGSLDPADFISVRQYIDVPALWTQITADLPEGAKHLAVRSRSAGTFMLHVDDIRYTGTPLDLTLSGYHVWRDGVRITTEPVTATEYVDADGLPGMKYRVSAVFDAGESRPGNEAWVQSDVITGVETGNAISISAGHECIIVGGADGMTIEIWHVDGNLARRLTGAPTTTVAIQAGIYIVKVGEKVAKVIVS